MALATYKDLVFSHSHKSSVLRALKHLTEGHGFDISNWELNFFLSCLRHDEYLHICFFTMFVLPYSMQEYKHL